MVLGSPEVKVFLKKKERARVLSYSVLRRFWIFCNLDFGHYRLYHDRHGQSIDVTRMGPVGLLGLMASGR